VSEISACPEIHGHEELCQCLRRLAWLSVAAVVAVMLSAVAGTATDARSPRERLRRGRAPRCAVRVRVLCGGGGGGRRSRPARARTRSTASAVGRKFRARRDDGGGGG